MSRTEYPIRFRRTETRFISEEPTDGECYFTNETFAWLEKAPEERDEEHDEERAVVVQRVTVLREWEKRVQALRCSGLHCKMTYDTPTKRLTVVVVNTEPAVYDDQIRFSHTRSLVVAPVEDDAIILFAQIVDCYFCETS